MTAMTFAIGGIAFWMPYYLVRRPGAPASATVIFGGVTCVAGLLATLAGGIAGDRLRTRFPGSYFLVSGFAMIAGFPFMLLTLRAPFPLIWVWLFVTCFCLFFNTGPTNTILANVTPPVDPRGGFCAQHLRHPRVRRRPLSRRHRRRRRPVRHEPRVHPRRARCSSSRASSG